MYCKNHLQRNLLILVIYFFISINFLRGQVKWDGEGGDGQWTNPVNWSGNILPAASDDVILDNSISVPGYTVTLPAGNSGIVIRSLTISPAAGQFIEVKIPAVNTAVPAFTATGPGYGLIINNVGIFRNASGASSGAPVAVSDSIRINNGGRYIHNTSRSHAGNVAVL